MKRNLSIEVKGREHSWSFNFKADPRYIEEWEADGLEVHEILNTIPLWVVRWNLMKPWCRMQDAWNWMKLW